MPSPLPPRVRCDFNSADEAGYFYALASADLEAVEAADGLVVLLYDWEDKRETEVLAQIGTLCRWKDGWRARGVGKIYVGPVPW